MISVVIVSHNGRKWLEGCLASLQGQTYSNHEIIIVDNASTDDTVRWIEFEYPQIKLITSMQNLGFASGSNLGIHNSKGDYILLLNNDTVADLRFLENLLIAFERVPNLGAVSGKIILMDEPSKLDNCGAFWTNTTFLYHYGYRQDESLSKFNGMMPVFSCNGAAMLVKREALDEVGLFDDDFWCYNEDVDLCHRLWIAGHECWYYPDAVVCHAKGATSSMMDSANVQYHSFKNRLASYIKNCEMLTLLWVLPIHLALNILIGLLWLIRGDFKLSLSVFRALWWNVVNARSTFAKRRRVQASRTKDDRSILSATRKNPPLKYYYYLLVGLDKYREEAGI